MQSDKAMELSGAVPIVPIPFDKNENSDEEALRRLVEFAASTGFAGICLPAYGSVSVLDGVAGLYLMELVPAGIAGVMSGMAIADALDVVFSLRSTNRSDEAFELYGQLLPFIDFGLQNFELWLSCKKRILRGSGLISNSICRNASIAPDPHSVGYVDQLSDRIMQILNKLGAA